MNAPYGLGSQAIESVIAALIAQKSPVLVEVWFPNMGTSPDWCLCEDRDELIPILDRLGPGAEIHLHSVWDLTDLIGGVVLKK
jgi:hypothetical protein